jgi:cellulose synthase/poly-beta-1,6-N-acetylglucosamine synthase-like glycosyltransferase
MSGFDRVGYPSLIGIVALKPKQGNKDCAYQPFVSIVVPRYNEEKVIEKRIIRDSHL